MPVPTDAFLAGMRRLAAGVTIVTTELDDVWAGLTATSVCSLTAAPPRLLACINRDAEAHDLIARRGAFAINVLTVAHRDLADRFGGRDDVFGPERFVPEQWDVGVLGLPLLVGAAALFQCRLVRSVAVGSHSIFIGEVEAMGPEGDGEPLVYHERGYHRLGPLPP